ncbi:MAG: hypothetical protein JXR97_16485 [Planctomycetes bacterium]|nr:hypothetical protein [Planctomycetota bacterium]
MRIYLTSLLLLLMGLLGARVTAAGEEESSQQKLQELAEREIGLRMDPILFTAAAQFLGGQEIGDIVPAGAISSAEDGYVVQEYCIVDTTGGVAGSFYRIRTLVANPVKDVAVIFDTKGAILDAFDLQAPKIDESSAKIVKTGEAKKEDGAGKGEDEGAPELDGKALRFTSTPTGAILGLMAGLDPKKEVEGMISVMRGLVQASELSAGGGMASINPAPADPKVFQVTIPLPKIGTQAPEFKFTTMDGKAVSNATFKGKPYVVALFSLKVMFGLASEDPLERRGAVIISRINRWMENEGKALAGKNRLVMIMTEEADILEKDEEGEAPSGTFVCDPKAGEVFGVDIRPAILVYGADGKLMKAYSATSELEEIMGELKSALK